jgi:hypothetical protein
MCLRCTNDYFVRATLTQNLGLSEPNFGGRPRWRESPNRRSPMWIGGSNLAMQCPRGSSKKGSLLKVPYSLAKKIGPTQNDSYIVNGKKREFLVPAQTKIGLKLLKQAQASWQILPMLSYRPGCSSEHGQQRPRVQLTA